MDNHELTIERTVTKVTQIYWNDHHGTGTGKSGVEPIKDISVSSVVCSCGAEFDTTDEGHLHLHKEAAAVGANVNPAATDIYQTAVDELANS